jgi:hypothetical protein
MIRSGDARSYDRQLKAICDKVWPAQARLAHSTFPNEHEWFGPTNYALDLVPGSGGSKIIFNIVSFLTMILALGAFISPIGAGIYYLADWEEQIVSGDVDLQYYAVLLSTGLAFAWFSNYMIVHTITERLKVR